MHPSRTTNINIVLIAYMQWDVCSAATMVGGANPISPHPITLGYNMSIYSIYESGAYESICVGWGAHFAQDFFVTPLATMCHPLKILIPFSTM